METPLNPVASCPGSVELLPQLRERCRSMNGAAGPLLGEVLLRFSRPPDTNAATTIRASTGLGPLTYRSPSMAAVDASPSRSGALAHRYSPAPARARSPTPGPAVVTPASAAQLIWRLICQGSARKWRQVIDLARLRVGPAGASWACVRATRGQTDMRGLVTAGRAVRLERPLV